MGGNCTGTERFFKVMMPGFHEKLNLPQAFCKKHQQEKLCKAVIKSPVGTCEIQVCRNQQGLISFEDGWPDFVHRHGLSFGDFVVFEHNGNFHFHAIVFELSACEKEYNFLEPKTKPKDHAPKTTKRAAEKKSVVSYQSKNPSFTLTIRHTHVKKRSELSIPMKFIRSNSIGDQTKVILRGPNGRDCPVNLCITKRGCQVRRCRIVRGWCDFCLNNNVKLGDVCAFELVTSNYVESTNTVLMEVHIFQSESS